MNSFYKKYLKYKKKYSKIKKQVGGMRDETVKVKDKEKEITVSFPDAYFCPIRETLFVDPVTTVDGITVEREAIEEWFQTHDTSPVTGAVINKLLIPNHALRNSIEDMKQDAYNKLFPQQIAASSSGMAAASSSEMAAASSSGMAAASSSGMTPVPFARLKFLKRNIGFNLYNNLAGGDLSLKDPSVECIDTIAYYNGNFWLITHPSHPNKDDLMKRYQVVTIQIPKSVVDNRGMWDS